MSVTARVCLYLAILVLGVVLAAEQEHDHHHTDLLSAIFRSRECGRKGLCPYVKRLIPHTYGYGVDSGHFLRPHASNIHEPPSLCGNLCTSDHQCPGYQKCCPTNCGYACFDPVYVTEH